MGTRILDSDGASTETGAVLFDSVSGWAFGPLFEDYDEAEAFLGWLPSQTQKDPRQLSGVQMEEFYGFWVEKREAEAEALDENPRYGPGNPDFDRDREKDRGAS